MTLTLTFESRCSRSIVSKTYRYSRMISIASSTLVISSPRTSIVAIFPASFSCETTRTASASSVPAM